MKPRIRRQFEKRKREITERLKPFIGGTEPKRHGGPEFSGPRPTYELAERTRAVSCAGVAAMHQLVREVGRGRVFVSVPAGGAATIRLLWSGPGTARGVIPSTALLAG